MEQVAASSASKTVARRSAPTHKSQRYGGTGGGDFSVSFGDTLTKIQTFSENGVLYGLNVSFDDGTVMLIGKSKGTPKSLTLTNDSISKIYILVRSNSVFGPDANHIGCCGLHIETLRGTAFTSHGAGSTPTSSYDWKLVSDADDLPCSNVYLAGLYGRSGNAIDSLGFFYHSDVLLSRVVRDINYDSLTPSTTPVPINVASAVIANSTDVAQETAISFSETVASTYTWSAQSGISVGMEVTLETKIPFIAEGKVAFSSTFSFSYTWGVTKSVSRVFSYTATVMVPSQTSIVARAKTASYQLSGTYKATYIENWLHAGVVKQPVEGIVQGVSAYSVSVTYEEQTTKTIETIELPEALLVA